MRMLSRTSAVLFLGTLVSGCAGMARQPVEMPHPAARAAEREAPRAPVAPDGRLVEQVTRIAAELSELQNAVARLIATSRDQEGQLQALHRRVSELAAVSRDGVGSTPRGFAPSPKPAGPTAEPSGEGASSPTATGPQELYQTGLAKFRAGELDAAVLLFYELIANYPTHPLRESAQVLVGDVFYAQKDLRGALAEFEGLLAARPTGPKAPDALLKLGLCQRGLGDEAGAQKTWERLMKEHPNTPAARQARVLLRGRGPG